MSDDEAKHEQRLGPVVALYGDKVHKVYYDALYRKPNLDTLKVMLEDKDAETWTSEDEKVIIMTMMHRECEWDNKDGVPVKVLLTL